jgi:transposase
MSSYVLQRELNLEKALELRSSGLSYGRISKIISVPEETIRRWCIKFASSSKNALPHPMKKKEQIDEQISEVNQSLPQDVLALQAELKKLRAELLNAEIKAEAYDELINVAESKFGIQIRKKAGAKQ